MSPSLSKIFDRLKMWWDNLKSRVKLFNSKIFKFLNLFSTDNVDSSSSSNSPSISFFFLARINGNTSSIDSSVDFCFYSRNASLIHYSLNFSVKCFRPFKCWVASSIVKFCFCNIALTLSIAVIFYSILLTYK